MAKILIVGCGAIGNELGRVLTESGHDVTGLKRNIPAPTDQMFKYVGADITSHESLLSLNTDFDYIFFIVSANRRNENSYRDIYETGIGNLLARFVVADSKAPWFFVSSTSVYGQTQGEWVNEDSPTSPNNNASQKIVQAEQKLTALNPDNVVVRFSGIYGPGREHLLRMSKQAPEIQQNPPYYTNRIHQRDCVGVLAFLLECRIKGVPLQQCYLASDNNPAPLWEVVSWIAEKTQSPPPKSTFAAHVADMNKRCDNTRIKALGYRFAYPDYKTGYAEMIDAKTQQI